METGNRLALDPHVAVENWEGYLDCTALPEQQGIPTLHWAPQHGAAVLGRAAPTTSSCENQLGLHPSSWDKRWPETQASSYRVQTQFLFIGIFPGLWQRRGNCLGGARDIQGETEFCGFTKRAGKKVAIVSMLSPLPMWQWAVSIFPVLGPPHTWPNLDFFWLGEPSSLYPGDSLGLHPTTSLLCTNRGFFSAGGQPLFACIAVPFGQLSRVHDSKQVTAGLSGL